MRISKRLLWILSAGLVGTLIVVAVVHTNEPRPRVQLADGRILQIEAATFGTNHVVGSHLGSLIQAARAALSADLGRFLPRLQPLLHHQSWRPSVMIWVSTFDPTTGQEVNAGGLGIDVVDNNGEVYCERGGGCAVAGKNFSRYGHGFDVYPRTQSKLTLRVTPQDTKQSSQIEIRNPRVVHPAAWSGTSLPQIRKVGNMEIALRSLVMRTNGFAGDQKTPCLFWQPLFELRDSGQMAVGWDSPSWEAEDPTGNRGWWLGVRQQVLRFDTSFYPNPTNTQAAMVIGTSPPIVLDTFATNISSWNLEIAYATQKIVVLGLFPPGTHVFSNGNYVTNPPVWSGGTSSGRPSGWDYHTRNKQSWLWSRHHAPVPIVYIKGPQLAAGAHLGVRIRDEQGHYWPTKLEPHAPGEIWAYLLDLPPDVQPAVAEFVVLKPVQAQFFVNTKSL